MPRIHTFGKQPALRLMRERQVTIAGAARAIEVYENHLRQAVHGRVAPSPTVRRELPKLLGLPLGDLFTPAALEARYDASKNAWLAIEGDPS